MPRYGTILVPIQIAGYQLIEKSPHTHRQLNVYLAGFRIRGFCHDTQLVTAYKRYADCHEAA